MSTDTTHATHMSMYQERARREREMEAKLAAYEAQQWASGEVIRIQRETLTECQALLDDLMCEMIIGEAPTDVTYDRVMALFRKIEAINTPPQGETTQIIQVREVSDE